MHHPKWRSSPPLPSYPSCHCGWFHFLTCKFRACVELLSALSLLKIGGPIIFPLLWTGGPIPHFLLLRIRWLFHLLWIGFTPILHVWFGCTALQLRIVGTVLQLRIGLRLPLLSSVGISWIIFLLLRSSLASAAGFYIATFLAGSLYNPPSHQIGWIIGDRMSCCHRCWDISTWEIPIWWTCYWSLAVWFPLFLDIEPLDPPFCFLTKSYIHSNWILSSMKHTFHKVYHSQA